jgi:hypothetical protein
VTPTAVRLAPSLLVTDNEIGAAVEILDVVSSEMLNEMSSEMPSEAKANDA